MQENRQYTEMLSFSSIFVYLSKWRVCDDNAELEITFVHRGKNQTNINSLDTWYCRENRNLWNYLCIFRWKAVTGRSGWEKINKVNQKNIWWQEAFPIEWSQESLDTNGARSIWFVFYCSRSCIFLVISSSAAVLLKTESHTHALTLVSAMNTWRFNLFIADEDSTPL